MTGPGFDSVFVELLIADSVRRASQRFPLFGQDDMTEIKPVVCVLRESNFGWLAAIEEARVFSKPFFFRIQRDRGIKARLSATVVTPVSGGPGRRRPHGLLHIPKEGAPPEST